MNGFVFEIGQKITPKKKEKWFYGTSGIESPGPKFGEIYTVKGYDPIPLKGLWFIYLEELDGSFHQLGFAPVVSDGVLSEALQEIFEEDLVIGK